MSIVLPYALALNANISPSHQPREFVKKRLCVIRCSLFDLNAHLLLEFLWNDWCVSVADFEYCKPLMGTMLYCSQSQQIIRWRTAALKLADLSSIKLVGLCCPDKKTIDQFIPATIRVSLVLAYIIILALVTTLHICILLPKSRCEKKKIMFSIFSLEI